MVECFRMNVIILSPHFPPNYHSFSIRLRQLGANVLSLADEPYEQLGPSLEGALVEYYHVHDMHDYDELLRACGYFTHRYGKIDRIESHNEYWLETDARLRTDFNVYGLKVDDMPKIRRKSRMKQVFLDAGVRVARGDVVYTLSEAKAFTDEVGFPVVAKPDRGLLSTQSAPWLLLQGLWSPSRISLTWS